MSPKQFGKSMTTAFRLFAVVWLIAGCAGLKSDRHVASDRARAYLSAHPELVSTTAEAIGSNSILVGMTMEQVVAAWGPPAVVQQFRAGAVQHWFFGCDWPHACEFQENRRKFRVSGAFVDPNQKYLSQALFENGVVVKWWS